MQRWEGDGGPRAVFRAARTRVPAHAWVFDRDFHLLLNLAIGGSWPGNRLDAATLPATMLIDWVRVRA